MLAIWWKPGDYLTSIYLLAFIGVAFLAHAVGGERLARKKRDRIARNSREEMCMQKRGEA